MTTTPRINQPWVKSEPQPQPNPQSESHAEPKPGSAVDDSAHSDAATSDLWASSPTRDLGLPPQVPFVILGIPGLAPDERGQCRERWVARNEYDGGRPEP